MTIPRPYLYSGAILIISALWFAGTNDDDDRIDTIPTPPITLPEQAQTSSAIQQNSTPQEKQTMPTPILIDVRSPEEFADVHRDGALSLPLDSIEKTITAQVPSKDTPIHLYCRSGARADSAKAILKKLGYTQVYNLHKETPPST